VLGIPGILLALLIMVTIKEPKRGRLDVVSDETAPSVVECFKFIWSQKAAVHAIWASGLSAFWGWGLMWFTPLYLQRMYGMDEGEAGRMLGWIYLFGGIAASLVTAWVVARPSYADPRRIARLLAVVTAIATIPSFLAYYTHDLSMAHLMWWLFIPAIYFYIGPAFALCQNLALAVAPLKTALFELELPETLTYPRFLQIAHKRTLSEVWHAHHNDQAVDWHLDSRLSNILLCSTAGLSVDDIVRRIEAHNLRNDEPVRVVIVDYFQLLQGKGATRYERFSNAAEACKVAAKKTNSVWIVVSQIQRPGENGGYEPHLHSGKETGSLENSSGLVLGFWRDENDANTAYCRILKNTKGRSGQKVECNYHGETLNITEKFNANV
jgi:hypothetical protein